MIPLGRFREPQDLLDKIKQLEQRIRNLENNARAGYTSADSGTQVFNTDDTNKFQVYINGAKQLEMGSTAGNPDIRFWRSNGLTAFFMTRFGNRDIIGFQDDSLHTIVADDPVTGFGLARPWIPVVFYDDISFAPSTTTTSGSFTDLQRAQYNIQHPLVYVRTHVVCSDGTTTGEIILTVDGEQVPATTVAIPASGIYDQYVNFAWYGLAHGTDCQLVVQGRRTAGAGTIGVKVINSVGRDTPIA